MSEPIRIFLSYTREDGKSVSEIYNWFKKVSFDAWMDTKDIPGGTQWWSQIVNYIECSRFFLACLSSNSLKKEGFQWKEIQLALDLLKKKSTHQFTIIPVRLEECSVPRCLEHLQYVSIFEKDGYEQLLAAIHSSLEQQIAASKLPTSDNLPDDVQNYLKYRINVYQTQRFGGRRSGSRLLKDLYIRLRALRAKTEEAYAWQRTTGEKWVEDMLEQGAERVAIIGNSGTGKTSLCLKYAHDIALQYEHRKEIPLLIPLRRALRSENILDFVRQKLLPGPESNRQFAGLAASWDQLPEYLGRVVLILDGIDEMPADVDPAQFLDGTERVRLLFGSSVSRVIVTCRTHYYQSHEELQERLDGFDILRLVPLRQEDIENLIRYYYTNEAKTYLELIRRTYNLQELAQVPKLLRLAVELLPNLGGDVPNAAALYGEYVRYWAEEDMPKRVANTTIEPEDWIHSMEELARKMFESGSGANPSISRRDLRGETLRMCEAFKVYEDQTRTTDHDVRTNLFLIRNEDDRYQFSHRSFYEFFLARQAMRELQQNPRRKDLLICQCKLTKGVADFAAELVEINADSDSAETSIKCLRKVLEVTKNRDTPERCRAFDNALQILKGLGASDRMRGIKATAPLQGLDLLGANLSGVDFTQCDLEGACLRGAILNGTVFTKANLRHSGLSGIDFSDDDILLRLTSSYNWQEANVSESSLKQLEEMKKRIINGSRIGHPMVVVKEGQCCMDGVRKATFTKSQESYSRINLPSFAIDKYPATNKEYRRFLSETGGAHGWWCHPNEPPGKNHAPSEEYNKHATIRGDYFVNPDYDNFPVVNIDWWDAFAFARWAGKFLPNELEWEKAASWDSQFAQSRAYPWGDSWDSKRCNTKESGIGRPTVVGQFSPLGDSPYGCSDMIGNVWEWTDSLSDRTEEFRVACGGSWRSERHKASCRERLSRNPMTRSNSQGFRCATTL